MAAVRAALEGMAREGDVDRGQAQVLEAAADEVGRISQKVSSLFDAALGAQPATGACRIAELGTRFQRALDPHASGAVTLACEDAWATITTDSARFAGALAGLVESLTREGAQVLVRMSYDEGLVVRILAHGANGSTRLDHGALDGLRLSFAEREFGALGVHLCWRATRSGGVRIALQSDGRTSSAFGGAA